MQVTDLEGVRWEVSRRWLELPRWRRWRPPVDSVWENIGDTGDAEIVVAVAFIVLLFVFLLVGIPVLLFLAAVAIAAASLAARVLFGRPWLVEAKSERGELQWRVRGTRGSRRAMQEIAAALRRGERDFSPKGAQRLLPESPLTTGERTSSVRVLRRRD